MLTLTISLFNERYFLSVLNTNSYSPYHTLHSKASALDIAKLLPVSYCDSDVTVFLLFWIMPIVQNGKMQFPY